MNDPVESVVGSVDFVEGVVGEEKLPGLEGVVAQKIGPDRVLRALTKLKSPIAIVWTSPGRRVASRSSVAL